MIINCTSESPRFKDRGMVIKKDIQEWWDAIPESARIEPVVWSYGSQRDPDERMIGLIAKWTEVT